jgi:hypothetical protein
MRAIQVTKVQEDSKYNQTNYFFDGLFGFGKYEGPAKQEVQYNIRGTFQEPSGKLEFAGKYTTTDEFYSQKRK